MIRQSSNYRFCKSFIAGLMLSFIALSTVTLSTYAQSADSPWPMYQHDPQHTGRSEYVGPQTNEVKWSYNTYGTYTTTGPVIDQNGTIYLGTSDGLLAVADNGSFRWLYPTSRVRQTPLIDPEGVIYAIIRDKILAISPAGQLKWEREIDTSYSSGSQFYLNVNLVMANNTLYYAAPQQVGTATKPSLIAIDPANGNTAWSYYLTEGSSTNPASSPTIAQDETIYIGFAQTLFAINPDGTEKWKKTFNVEKALDNNIGTACVDSGGTIYLTVQATYYWVGIGTDGYGDSLYALSPDGGEKWKYSSQWILDPFLIGPDETIYLSGKSWAFDHWRSYVCAIDFQGNLEWHLQKGDYTLRLVDARGNIYGKRGSYRVLALNSQGDEIWSYYTGYPNIFGFPFALSPHGILYAPASSILFAFGSTEIQTPIASFSYSPESPGLGEEVTFDASSSTDPDGEIVSYEWDWNNDGVYDESTTSLTVTHSWNEEGTYQVGLRVTDNDGTTDSTSKEVTIKPNLLEKYAPILYLHPDEQLYPWGIFSILDHSDLKNGEEISKPRPGDLESHNSEKYYLDLWEGEPGFGSFGVPNRPEEIWGKWQEATEFTFSVYGRYYEPPDHPDKIVLQYWFFYPFNDFTTNHEGDWEMMQVILNKTPEGPEPEEVSYSSHWDGAWDYWNNIHSTVEDTHSRVFIAKGSHGSWISDKARGMDENNTSGSGKALYPKNVSPSAISGIEDRNKKSYTLVDVSSGSTWTYWEGRWGKLVSELLEFFNGPKSPTKIKYWDESQDEPRWEDPIGWHENLLWEELLKLSYSQWGANARSTPSVIQRFTTGQKSNAQLTPSILLHVYDSYGNHAGLMETGEIEASIPGTYFYVPSAYSDDQKEQVWIYTSEDLRFEIEGDAEGEFDFTFYRYLREKRTEITVTYQNVPFSEDTIATVDVSPENPMFAMEIDIDGDEVIDEVKYPNYIENLVADIQATIDIDPDVLNLKSKSRWITCYIELPDGYDINNVDIDTILLMINEGVVTEVAESSPSEINDYDNDNIPDLMVKFDRATLITYLKDHNLTSGQVTLRVIGQVDNKIFEGTDIITIKGGEASKTEEAIAQSKFSLSQNYPNPFNPQTTIEYSLAEGCHVMLKIYNIAGQLVKTLINEYQQAGSYTIIWYGDNDVGEEVARGLYFYQLQAGDFVSTKKMVVLK